MSGYLTGDTRGTWVGHALLTVAVGLAVSLAVRFWPVAAPDLAFGLGTLLTALYFTHREITDTLRHRLRGDYDALQAGGHATSRADRTGDMLGPWCVTVGAWATLLMGWI